MKKISLNLSEEILKEIGTIAHENSIDLTTSISMLLKYSVKEYSEKKFTIQKQEPLVIKKN